MAAYDFAVDTDKIQAIIDEMGTVDGSGIIGTVSGCIDSIYGKINDLNTHWSGESYTSFKEQCIAYKAALEGLEATLTAFVNILKTISDNAGVANTKIDAACSIGS